MDRIIEVKVGGNHLSKDNKYAGVRGEGNATNLRITFDEGWASYAKTVTFWDALGGNATKRIQGIDLLEDITVSKRTYITPIPPEVMCYAGEISFVIDGYTDGKRQRSISSTLVVKDSPVALGPIDPTPTQAEQLQVQIDKFMDNAQKAVIARDEAGGFSQNAENSAKNALNSSNQAKEYAERVEGFVGVANLAADRAEEAIAHNPIIIDGYWHIWLTQSEEYVNTGVKAQAGSEVYVGDNPPDVADVWLDPNGESAIYAPYIGENGNWYTFNPETQTFTDSGNRATGKDGDKGDDGLSAYEIALKEGFIGSETKWLAGLKGEDGHTPVKGEDYFTEEEQNNLVVEATEKVFDNIKDNGITTEGTVESLKLKAKKAEIGTFNDELGAVGENAVSTGNYTIAKGNHSFSANHLTQANHVRSSAFGNNTKTSATDQLVCGKFNDNTVDSSLFQVGCGTSKDNRKNAVNVTDKGDLQVLRNVVSDATPTEGNHLVNKAFMENAISTLSFPSVSFRSAKLVSGDTFPIKPGMIFFFQSDSSGIIATVTGYTSDAGDFSHDIYGLTFGFCTECGATHDKESDYYRMSLNYKDGGFTTDFESKNKYLGKSNNPRITAKTDLYIWYMERM